MTSSLKIALILSGIIVLVDAAIGPLLVMPLHWQPVILDPWLWFGLGLASLALASWIAIAIPKVSSRWAALLIGVHLILAALQFYWGWELGAALSI